MSYGFTVTSKGAALLAKLLAGEQLLLTRVMVGKGKLPDDVNPMSLTDLIDPVAQGTSDKPVVSENTVSFMVEYRNNLNGGLKEGFWLNEFSVYAADPQEGEVMLYYATLGDFPRYISAYSKDKYVDGQRFPVTISITSEPKPDIEYRPLASLTAEDLYKHVESPCAHDADLIAYSNPDLPEIKTVKQMLDSLNENITTIIITKASKEYVDTAIESAINMTVRLEIFFAPDFAGKDFTVTAENFEYNGAVPADLKAIVSASVLNTTYTIECDGISGYITTGSSFGIYSTPFPTTLANYSWTQIAGISASGKLLQYFQIGDEKDFVLTSGEMLTLQIYGFGHDNLADGSGKAGATFGLKNLMKDARRMNATNTNVGGITATEMQSYLEDELFNLLPADLRAVIKPVNKKTSAGNANSTINTNSMRIFLLSEIECFGSVTYSVAGEGSKYPIFTDAASRIKRLSNGSGTVKQWWGRSPRVNYATTFCNIDSSGNSGGGIVADSDLGVCFALCI